jgi:glutathione S-transferase
MVSDSLKIFGDSISGNCYKLQLACAQLGVDYDWHETDILAGESRSSEFLAMNSNGKVPIAQLPDGRCLAESNAILCYLADGTDLAGKSRYHKASVLQWMFFEQYSHEPYIATSRFIMRYLGNPPDRQTELEAKHAGGEKALSVMDGHLQSRDFFVDDAYSIADIALFAYTHVAGEGGFDLGGYPKVTAWLSRVEQQDGYVPMQARG